MSAGTNSLISKGEAKLVRSARDILAEYEARFPHKLHGSVPLTREEAAQRLSAAPDAAREPEAAPAEEAAQGLPAAPRSALDAMGDEQREIFWLLSEHTLVPDEIVGRTEIPARRVNTALTLLQAGGYIKELPGKRFTAAVRFAED